MSENKTTTGILRYPYEGITDTTDYLQITIKKNPSLSPDNKAKFIEDAAYAYSSNPASVSGISASFLKPQVLAENGIILLPMPSNIQDSNSVSYDNDSMNALSAFGAQTALNVMKDFDITKPGESGAITAKPLEQAVLETATDTARIFNNAGTIQGRVGSVMTESTLKASQNTLFEYLSKMSEIKNENGELD